MNIPKLSIHKPNDITEISVVKYYSTRESCPLHTHNYYELCYINKGKTTHYVNGKSQLLEEGAFVFIRPKDIHTFIALNYFDFEVYAVGFLEEELLYTLNYLNINLSKILNTEIPLHYSMHGNTKVFIEQQLDLLCEKKQKKVDKKFFAHFFL